MSLSEKERQYWDTKAEGLKGLFSLDDKEKLVRELCDQKNWFWWEKLVGQLHNKKILDVGCGIGNLIAYWNLTENTAYGTDISKEGLKNSQRIHSTLRLDARVVNSTIENLPFADSSFDIVHLRWVIHHLSKEKTSESLKEIRRILKKNGYLLLCETNYRYPIRWLVQTPHLSRINIFKRLAIEKGILDPDEKALTSQEYLKLLQDADFKIAKVNFDRGLLWYLPQLFTTNQTLIYALQKIDKKIARVIPKPFCINILVASKKVD
jgi:ubiquinone/menaquinone biosynthesis C-methylase UbiE